MNQNQLEKLHGLLKDFSTVILVTMGGPTCCHARPMAVAQVDENTDIWLFTSGDSEKVRQIWADSRVQVHAQQGYTSCVILAGRATVVEDHAKICEIWKPSFKPGFRR
jgi:general stress protein 26